MELKRYKVFASYEGKLTIDADPNGEFVYAKDALKEIEKLEYEVDRLGDILDREERRERFNT
jgi:hypothetical protein